MSSRQEEKERRRQERMEREAAERRAAARKKRLGLVVGGLIAVLVLAGAAFAVVGAVGGEDSSPQASGNGNGEQANVSIPPQETSDLQEAAKAAGCKLETLAYEGAGHDEKEFKPSDYQSNPPTSGPHNPQWYEDGIYEPGTTPKLGELVHTLEHGRINIQYKKGTPPETVEKLEALYSDMSEGYHLMLYENTTGMEEAIAATAWTQKLGCPEFNDKVFDAIRTFRTRYIDKGPERVP